MLKGPSSPAATGTKGGPKQPPAAAIAAAKARSVGVAIPLPKPSTAAPTDGARSSISTVSTTESRSSVHPPHTVGVSTTASSSTMVMLPLQVQQAAALPTLFTVAFAGLPAVSLPLDAQRLSTIALPNWGMVWRRDHAHLVIEQNFLFENGLLKNSGSVSGGGSNTPATNSSPPSSATFLLQQHQQQQQQQKSSNLKSLLLGAAGAGGGGLSSAIAVTSFGSSFEGSAVAPREGGGKAAAGGTPASSVGFGAFGTFFTTTYSLTNATLWASKSRSTGALVGDPRREGGGGGAASRRGAGGRSPTIASVRSSSPSSSSQTKRNRGMTSFSFSFASSSPSAADGSTDLGATGTPIPAVYLTLGGSGEDDPVGGETDMKNGARQAHSSSQKQSSSGGLGGTSSCGDYSIDGMAQLLAGQSNGSNSGGLIGGSVDGAVEGLMEAGAAVGALIGKSNRVVSNAIQSAANFLLVKKDENDIASSPQGDAVDAGGAAGRTLSATSATVGGSTAPPYSSFSSSTGVATQHISSSAAQALAAAIETTANKPLTIRLDDFLIQSVPKMVVAPSFEAMAEMEERLTFALASTSNGTITTTTTTTSSTAAGSAKPVSSSLSDNDSFGSLLGSDAAEQSRGEGGNNTNQKRIVDLILATFYQTPTHGKDLFAENSSSSSSSSEAPLSDNEADEAVAGGEKEGKKGGNGNSNINNNKKEVTSNGSSTRSSSTQSKSRSATTTPTTPTTKRPNFSSGSNTNAGNGEDTSTRVRPSDSLLSDRPTGGRREGKGATSSSSSSSRGAMATTDGPASSSASTGGTQQQHHLLTTAKVTASKIPAGRGLRERNPTWYHGEYFLRLVPKNVAAMRSAAIAQRTHALLMSRANSNSGVGNSSDVGGNNNNSSGGGGESALLLPLVNHIVNDQQQKGLGGGGGLPPLLAHFLLSFALKGVGGVKNHSAKKESREDERSLDEKRRGASSSKIISSSFTDNAAFLDDVIEDGNAKKNNNNNNVAAVFAASDPLLLDSFDFYDPSTVIDLHFRSGRERDRWLNILLSLKSGPQTEDETFPFGRGHLPPPPLPIASRGKAGGLSKKSKEDESGEGALSSGVGGGVGANGVVAAVGEGTTVLLGKDTDVFALSPAALASLPPPRVSPADGSVTVFGGAMVVIMDPSQHHYHQHQHLTERGLVGEGGGGWAGLGGRGQALHTVFGGGGIASHPNAALTGIKGTEHHQQGVSIGGLSSSRSTSGTATPAQTAQYSGGGGGTPTSTPTGGGRSRRALYPFSQQQGADPDNLGLPLSDTTHATTVASSHSPSLALAGSDPLLFLAKLGRGVARGGDAREALHQAGKEDHSTYKNTTPRRRSTENTTMPHMPQQLDNDVSDDNRPPQREENLVTSTAFVVVHREVVFSTAQDGGFTKKSGAELEMGAAAADVPATSDPREFSTTISKNLMSLSRGLFPPYPTPVHQTNPLFNASFCRIARAHRLYYYTPNGTTNPDKGAGHKEEEKEVRSKEGTTANTNKRNQNYFLCPEDHACSIAFTTRRWNPLLTKPKREAATKEKEEEGWGRKSSSTDCCSIWWMEITARAETKAMARRSRRADGRNRETAQRRGIKKATSPAAVPLVINNNVGAEVIREGGKATQYNATTTSCVWDATATPRGEGNLILDEDLAIDNNRKFRYGIHDNKNAALQSRESLLREFEALFASSDDEEAADKVASSERLLLSGGLQDVRMGTKGATTGGLSQKGRRRAEHFNNNNNNNNEPDENSDFEGLLLSPDDHDELRSGDEKDRSTNKLFFARKQEDGRFNEASDNTDEDGFASDSFGGQQECDSADSYQSISVPIHAVDCLVSYERVFCAVDEEDDDDEGTRQSLFRQNKEDAYLIADFTTHNAVSSKFTTSTTNSINMGNRLVLFSASGLTADKACEEGEGGAWDKTKMGTELAFATKSNNSFSVVPYLLPSSGEAKRTTGVTQGVVYTIVGSATMAPLSSPPPPHLPLGASSIQSSARVSRVGSSSFTCTSAPTPTPASHPPHHQAHSKPKDAAPSSLFPPLHCAVLSIPPERIKSGISSMNSDLLEQLRIDTSTKRAEAEAIMHKIRSSSFSHSLSSPRRGARGKESSVAVVQSSSPRKKVKKQYYDESGELVATFDAILDTYMLEKTRLCALSSPPLPPSRPFSSSSPSSVLREKRNNRNSSGGSRGGIRSTVDSGAVTVYYLDVWYWWLASSDQLQNINEEKENEEQGKKSTSKSPPSPLDRRRCFLEPRKVTLAFATSADRDAFARVLARRWKEAVVASLIIASSSSSSSWLSPMPSKGTSAGSAITGTSSAADLAVLHTILRRIFQCTSPEELLVSMGKADEIYSDHFAFSSSPSRAVTPSLHYNDYLQRLSLLWSSTFNSNCSTSSAKSGYNITRNVNIGGHNLGGNSDQRATRSTRQDPAELSINLLSTSDLHRISLLDRAPPFCFDTT